MNKLLVLFAACALPSEQTVSPLCRPQHMISKEEKAIKSILSKKLDVMMKIIKRMMIEKMKLRLKRGKGGEVDSIKKLSM